jgi:DNA-binding transcriptional regulator YiaG
VTELAGEPMSRRTVQDWANDQSRPPAVVSALLRLLEERTEKK